VLKLWRMGCSKVHLEGDAKGVIDAVNSENAYRSWMGHMIEHIKVELQSFVH
jgi:hypothetical protein